jgi:hypothetical protein
MPEAVLRAYRDWQNATPAGEKAALLRLVGVVMDHRVQLFSLFGPTQITDAVIQGIGNQTLGIVVGQAWGLYKRRQPSGPAAVAEATQWLLWLIPNAAQRRRQFTAVLDNLVARA